MRAIGIADLREAKDLEVVHPYMAVVVKSQTH